MSQLLIAEIRVIAIDPSTKGFGFAVMEGPDRLIDWGVKETNGGNKNGICLQLIAELIDRYKPGALVIEDAERRSRRCKRIRALLEDISKLAAESKIPVRRFARSAVREIFSEFGAWTKHEIATAIAQRLPELGPRLPPFRYPWMSMDYRMAIFNAVALALTYFFKRQKASTISKSSITQNDQQ